jgi:hypothetical protein
MEIDDEDKVGDRTDSGFVSGNEDEYDGAVSPSLVTSVSPTAYHERDLLPSASVCSTMWSGYFDSPGMDAAFPPGTPSLNGVAPLTTPAVQSTSWVPEVVEVPAAAASLQPKSPYKDTFMSSVSTPPASSSNGFLDPKVLGIMSRSSVGPVGHFDPGVENHIVPQSCRESSLRVVVLLEGIL